LGHEPLVVDRPSGNTKATVLNPTDRSGLATPNVYTEAPLPISPVDDITLPLDDGNILISAQFIRVNEYGN